MTMMLHQEDLVFRRIFFLFLHFEMQAHSKHVLHRFDYTYGFKGRGRESIFAAHHGQGRRLGGVFHTCDAQSPHCLACWHGQNM
jgi:hypothetical protein